MIISECMHGLQACLFKYITVAAICIYAQRSEDASKGGGLNSHGNYIVDHGKSWKNHGIVCLNFCGNPEIYNVFSESLQHHYAISSSIT